MKTRLLSHMKVIMQDRTLLFLAAAIVILAVVYIVYASLLIHQKDIQVVTHYSAFGVTHFYRTKWFYLLSFVLFGVMVLTMHLVLLTKLALQNMRPLAVAYGWLSIALLVVAGILTHSVFSLAFLQ